MFFDIGNNAQSPFNIGLGSKINTHENLRAYLNAIFNRFANDMQINRDYLREMPFRLVFTDVEFGQIVPDDSEESFINAHFYPKVFHEIHKIEPNRLVFHVKYCFTLDSSLTPFQTTSGIRYGQVLLGRKPVLYYLLVEVQELINHIKSSSKH